MGTLIYKSYPQGRWTLTQQRNSEEAHACHYVLYSKHWVWQAFVSCDWTEVAWNSVFLLFIGVFWSLPARNPATKHENVKFPSQTLVLTRTFPLGIGGGVCGSPCTYSVVLPLIFPIELVAQINHQPGGPGYFISHLPIDLLGMTRSWASDKPSFIGLWRKTSRHISSSCSLVMTKM